MKKLAIVAAIATSAAVAAPFNGFSVGGSLGVNFTKHKFTVAGVETSKNKTGFLGNVFAGYTKSFSNMIAGADVVLGLSNVKGDGVRVTKTIRTTSIAIAPRVGYKFNETSAVYAKFAIAHNSYNFDAAAALLMKKKNISYTPAVGFEKFVNSNGSVRAELGYEMSKYKLPAGSAVSKASKNAVVATVGYAYSF
ncbi:MAG: outer membrane beta-barrel protein [Proteobacteria bacterium]|nr:outer membrane beta-barrel protein [Pseudomonadota bacterium]